MHSKNIEIEFLRLFFKKHIQHRFSKLNLSVILNRRKILSLNEIKSYWSVHIANIKRKASNDRVSFYINIPYYWLFWRFC